MSAIPHLARGRQWTRCARLTQVSLKESLADMVNTDLHRIGITSVHLAREVRSRSKPAPLKPMARSFFTLSCPLTSLTLQRAIHLAVSAEQPAVRYYGSQRES